MTATHQLRQGQGRSADVCDDCGIALTAPEEKAFLYRCAPCQIDHVERVYRWMGGVPDRYLDVFYQNSKPRAYH